MYDKFPRGIRNNNPLNIKISSSNWIGKRLSNSDGIFEQFDTLMLGYRAALVIIRNYINLYNLHYISPIIRRWAPHSENDVSAYVKFVCDKATIDVNTYISFSNKPLICDIVFAMALYENGVRYSDDLHICDLIDAYDLLTK